MPEASKSKPRSPRERPREFRGRMRAQGSHPVVFWVPDVNSPEFKADAHRHSLAVANSPQEADDQALIDAISVGIFD